MGIWYWAILTQTNEFQKLQTDLSFINHFIPTLQIYTNIGEVVVSVNPYRFIDIYNDEYVEEYRGKEFYERPPHIFAIADAAFHDMQRLHTNSCILISGQWIFRSISLLYIWLF